MKKVLIAILVAVSSTAVANDINKAEELKAQTDLVLRIKTGEILCWKAKNEAISGSLLCSFKLPSGSMSMIDIDKSPIGDKEDEFSL